MADRKALEAAARAATRLKARADAYNDRGGSYAYIGDDVFLDDEAARLLAALAAENERMKAGLTGIIDAVVYTEGEGGRRSYVLRPSFAAAFQEARALTQGDRNAG